MSVTPGTAYELCIDLQATAVTFLPGRRLRVDVTSSSHPRWSRHIVLDDDALARAGRRSDPHAAGWTSALRPRSFRCTL